jgi:hypothetical protein
MMQEKQCKLELQDENFYAESFNSDISNEDFKALFNDINKEQRKDLINIILKQAF